MFLLFYDFIIEGGGVGACCQNKAMCISVLIVSLEAT